MKITDFHGRHIQPRMKLRNNATSPPPDKTYTGLSSACPRLDHRLLHSFTHKQPPQENKKYPCNTMTWKLFMTYAPITHKFIHNPDRQKIGDTFQPAPAGLHAGTAS
ncbi:hypothetical protein [Janthinobacterium sp. LB3P112]|uniref:hypothetical protein n=1 Tax=Janthinobacterium sp. LB3P112 TaxID=3424196 RepID=UPI003F1E6838